jgi:iron complex outermembrane receptor protein/vitamin B12 transporter
MKITTGVILCFALLTLPASAQQIAGTVRDSLGAVVPNANVQLLEAGNETGATTTNAAGHYEFAVQHAARYQVRAGAPQFAAALSRDHYGAPGEASTIDLTLFPSAVHQEVVVTATGFAIPETQTGASITALDAAQLDQKPEVQDALRLVPGAQLAQSGPLGGATSLFLRGGNSDENKVLIDGIPLDDIGLGYVDFGNISAAAIDRVEVYRGPNSALFGSDAMAAVVDIQTRRGSTLTPELTYSTEGGNFGTYMQDASLGGAWRRFDYFSDFARWDTQNNEPNSAFHNETYSGNFGWSVLPDTEVRATVRRSVSAFGLANQIGVNVIPDDANDRSTSLLFGGTIDSHTTTRWHNVLRYGAARLRYLYTDPAPSGTPYPSADFPFGYLGAPVTLTGGNGYSASGQAILSYPGTYPGSYAVLTNRDFMYAQSDYRVNRHLTVLGAFRYEDERGYTASTGNSTVSTERGNYSYIMQIQGELWNRAYYTLGSSIENNAVYGVAGTPRASLAYYLIRPASASVFSGTQLKFNFGKGVKEPSLTYEAESLYNLLKALPNGQSLIQQYGVTPIAPELSRSYDGGVNQQLFGGHGRLGVTYFHNEFGNEVEYVPSTALPQFNIPVSLISLANLYGAAVNSLAYRAQGVETELEYRWHSLNARGGYTYLDAVVQHSLSSAAVYNPNLPGIPIGAYAPLVGARPFRRAPHTGYAAVDLTRPRWILSVSGTFVGERDDSTEATDENFGNTLLLPNRNLLAGYQRIDLTAKYQVNSVLSLIAGAQNLLNEHYQEAYGYPTLPFTFRAGVRLTIGGEPEPKKMKGVKS